MQDVIVALCRRMRETQDFSAFPILADAVEESGDATLASVYRHPHLHFGERAFIVDSILGLDEPWRQLSDWIRHDYYPEGDDPEYSCYRDYDHPWQNGPLTAENLVTILHHHVNRLPGDFYVAFGFDEKPGRYQLAEMWRLFGLITGHEAEDNEESVFSCGC